MSDDFGQRTSAESAEGARVVQMLPTWPMVRCDSCGLQYGIALPMEGLVVGNCPACGGERFSTTMVTGTAS